MNDVFIVHNGRFVSEDSLSRDTILITQGISSAKAVNHATDTPVVGSMTDDGLAPLARKVRELFPKAAITLCASLRSEELCKSIAREIGGNSVAPFFTEKEKGQHLNSFADLNQSRPESCVKQLGFLKKEKGLDRQNGRSAAL